MRRMVRWWIGEGAGWLRKCDQAPVLSGTIQMGRTRREDSWGGMTLDRRAKRARKGLSRP